MFLDRDGVVNEERHYLHDPADAVIIGGVAAAIAAFNRRQVPVVVVSNQAGIGRGLYRASDWTSVNQRIAQLLSSEAAHVDAWYCCPHVPLDACSCRKPAAGMLLSAAADLSLDLARSLLVGDKESDLRAARAAGCRAFLVRTGYGREVEKELIAAGATHLFDRCCDSLAELGSEPGAFPPTTSL